MNLLSKLAPFLTHIICHSVAFSQDISEQGIIIYFAQRVCHTKLIALCMAAFDFEYLEEDAFSVQCKLRSLQQKKTLCR